MTIGTSRFAKETNLPTGLYLVCILLLIDGVLVLLGCIFYPGQDAARPYYVVGSVIAMATGILILMNHKWALPFSLVCAVLFTVDAALTFIPFGAFIQSVHPLLDTARTLFNIGLYWAGFLWYRRWHTATRTD